MSLMTAVPSIVPRIGSARFPRRAVRRIFPIAVAAAIALFAGRSGSAEDCRIYTMVYDESVEPSGIADRFLPNKIVARSLSLTHADKVYDSIDSIGEVVIFDPTQRRFHILNTRHALAAVITFDEIKHLLKQAYDATKDYAVKIDSSQSPPDPRTSAALRFQLEPQFAEEYDAERRLLTLSSPAMRYVVRCAVDKPTDTVDSYLRYADWTSRLNYLLHPNILLPAPRLALNEALRRRGLLPYEVRLQAEFGGTLRLRAEHQITWELGTKDRTLISEWERLLADDQMRQVSLRQYQAAVLKRELSKR